jgi:hypothetical protein
MGFSWKAGLIGFCIFLTGLLMFATWQWYLHREVVEPLIGLIIPAWFMLLILLKEVVLEEEVDSE